jgi:very-short-patch-repair endonuclease
MLAIEVDGISHNNEEASAKDDVRQLALEKLGIKFIRFSEGDMKYDMINVMRAIEAKVIEIVKTKPDLKLPKSFDVSVLED